MSKQEYINGIPVGDICDRLKAIADLRRGDPLPEWFAPDPFDWSTPMSNLLYEALAEIQRLQEALDRYRKI